MTLRSVREEPAIIESRTNHPLLTDKCLVCEFFKVGIYSWRCLSNTNSFPSLDIFYLLAFYSSYLAQLVSFWLHFPPCFISSFLFLSVCSHARVFTHTQMHLCTCPCWHRIKGEDWIPRARMLHVLQTWIIIPESSARAARTLNLWAIAPAAVPLLKFSRFQMEQGGRNILVNFYYCIIVYCRESLLKTHCWFLLFPVKTYGSKQNLR